MGWDILSSLRPHQEDMSTAEEAYAPITLLSGGTNTENEDDTALDIESNFEQAAGDSRSHRAWSPISCRSEDVSFVT